MCSCFILAKSRRARLIPFARTPSDLLEQAEDRTQKYLSSYLDSPDSMTWVSVPGTIYQTVQAQASPSVNELTNTYLGKWILRLKEIL